VGGASRDLLHELTEDVETAGVVNAITGLLPVCQPNPANPPTSSGRTSEPDERGSPASHYSDRGDIVLVNNGRAMDEATEFRQWSTKVNTVFGIVEGTEEGLVRLTGQDPNC
jgi:hypothetical protein